MIFKKIKVLGLICFLYFNCFSQSGTIQLSSNYYVTGVNTKKFNYIQSIGKQRGMNWCWAACIQMVLNYHGLKVSQEDIVRKCYGGLIDAPGGAYEMLTALNGWAYNSRGGISKIYTDPYPTNANEIQAWLSKNWPLIVGLNYGTSIGHAYVLTGIYYSLSYDISGNLLVIPDKVVLRDPWPGSSPRIEMSWNQFSNGVVSVYKVWVEDLNTTSYYTTSYNRVPLIDWDGLYSIWESSRIEIEDKGEFNWVLSSSFTFVETGSGPPLTLYLEKYFINNNYSLRGNLQFCKRNSNEQKERYYTNRYFSLGIDVKKIFHRKYRWNWFISPTFNIRALKISYDSTYYTNNNQIEIKNHLFTGIRIGGDRYSGKRLYITWDYGLGYHSYYKKITSEMNILIGWRLDKLFN